MTTKPTRHWRPYKKLTTSEVWLIKRIGTARNVSEVRALLKRGGKLKRWERIIAKREKEWRKRGHGAGTAPDPKSSATIGMVFGVGHRIIAYIWSGRYWADV
jgi:hypothetical protein